MAATKSFECPNCGSPIMPTGTEAEVRCPYCGTTVIVPEELRGGLPEKEEPAPEINQVEELIQRERMAREGQLEAALAAQQRNKRGTGPAKFIGIGVGVVVVICLAVIIPLVASGAVGAWLGRLTASSSNATQPATSAATEPPEATASPAPTATPAPTAVPTIIDTPVPFTKVLFKDNFLNPASGWNVHNGSDYVEEYVNGEYRILIENQNSGQLVWLTTVYTDVSVQVDAQQTAGPNDGWMGVTCRASNDGTMYGFEFAQNGAYGIYKYASDGTSSELAGGTLDTNTVKQNGVNVIGGVCSGSTLTLLLNGQALAQAADSSYPSGAVGLTVNTGDSGQPGEDVLYSNYVAMGP